MARSRKSKKSSEKTAEGAEIENKIVDETPEIEGELSAETKPEDIESLEQVVEETDSVVAEATDDGSSEIENVLEADPTETDAAAAPDVNEVDDASLSDVDGDQDTVDDSDDTSTSETEYDVDAEETASEISEEADADSNSEQADPTDEDDTQSDVEEVASEESDTPEDADELAESVEDATENVEKEVAQEAPPQPTTIIEQRNGSAWPGIFGGIIAALIGFIVGKSDQFDSYLPAFLQTEQVDISGLEAQAASLAEANAAQAERIAALESVEPVEAGVDLTDEVTSLEASLAALVDRIAALESRPEAEPSVEGASTEELAELQSALDAQNAEIAALAARAAEAEERAAGEAARILARAALTRVVTSVDSGESYSTALSDLEEVTPVEVPQPLRDAAETGVPTMNALRESYPEAARAALAAVRAETPESEVQGVTGFLKRQLSARSVVPREGDDPDAILSRAEAAVRAGDLGTALTEMEALPDVARSAMDEWLQAASARKAAQDAAQDLADSLNSN